MRTSHTITCVAKSAESRENMVWSTSPNPKVEGPIAISRQNEIIVAAANVNRSRIRRVNCLRYPAAISFFKSDNFYWFKITLIPQRKHLSTVKPKIAHLFLSKLHADSVYRTIRGVSIWPWLLPRQY